MHIGRVALMGDFVIFRLGALLCIAALLIAPVGAEESVDERIAVQITVSRVSSGVEVNYVLSSPVTEFEFAQQQLDIRGRSWQVKQKGLLIANGVVRSPKALPFDAFRIHIKPDELIGEQRYFGLLKIGEEGLLLSAHVLLGDVTRYKNQMCIVADAERCERFDTPPPFYKIKAAGLLDDLTLKYRAGIYLGPDSFIAHGTHQSLVDSRLPPGVRDGVDDIYSSIINFYKQRFGRELSELPSLLVTWRAKGKRLYVTEYPLAYYALLFSVFGNIAEEAEQELLDVIRIKASEKMSNFFSFEYLATTEFREMRWFYPGISWLLSFESAPAGRYETDDDRMSWLELYVRYCQGELLGEGPPEDNKPMETCGGTLHALAAYVVANASSGERDWVDLLSSIVDKRRSYDKHFSEEYFNALASYDLERKLEGLFQSLRSNDGSAFDRLNDTLSSFGLDYLVLNIERAPGQ